MNNTHNCSEAQIQVGEAGENNQQVSYNRENIVSHSRSTSVGSMEPDPRDFNTPEPMDDTPLVNECWSQDDINDLQQWEKYSIDLINCVSAITQEGRQSTLKIPSKPRRTLQSLLGKCSNKKPALTNEDLHKYLVSELADMANVKLERWNPESLETMIPTLKNGQALFQQHNAKLIGHYLLYGKVLNEAYDMFSLGKIKGEIPSYKTWKDWLKSEVGISDTFAKQMRDMYSLFGDYKRIYYLGIPFSEFKTRKEAIRLLFRMNPDCAAWWKHEHA